MPGEMVTIVRRCGACRTEVETLTIKKENMMLSSKATIWCPRCQAQRPELRDVAGRLAAIQKEAETLPRPARTQEHGAEAPDLRSR